MSKTLGVGVENAVLHTDDTHHRLANLDRACEPNFELISFVLRTARYPLVE